MVLIRLVIKNLQLNFEILIDSLFAINRDVYFYLISDFLRVLRKHGLIETNIHLFNFKFWNVTLSSAYMEASEPK